MPMRDACRWGCLDCWICCVCRLLIADASLLLLLLLLLRVAVMCFTIVRMAVEMSGRRWVDLWSGYLHPCGLSYACLPADRQTDGERYATNPCVATYSLQPTIHTTARDAVVVALATDTI